MAWVKLDDQAPRNEKMLKAGPAACWLWVCGIAHAQSQLTDGFVSFEALPMIGVLGLARCKRLADELVRVGLFDAANGGYTVHDYLEHNPSKAQVLAKRAEDAARKHRGESERNPNGIHVESGAPRAGVPSHPIPSHPRPSGKASDGRSKRPIFTGQRLTVFEWMFDDCKRTLGEHLDAFGLDEWFYDVDQRAVDQGLVIPKRDGGEWLQAQLVMEAQRRGMPLRFAAKPTAVSGSTCPHVPRCASTTACIERTLADGRAARSA